jgi:hypothetical protein
MDSLSIDETDQWQMAIARESELNRQWEAGRSRKGRTGTVELGSSRGSRKIVVVKNDTSTFALALAVALGRLDGRGFGRRGIGAGRFRSEFGKDVKDLQFASCNEKIEDLCCLHSSRQCVQASAACIAAKQEGRKGAYLGPIKFPPNLNDPPDPRQFHDPLDVYLIRLGSLCARTCPEEEVVLREDDEGSSGRFGGEFGERAEGGKGQSTTVEQRVGNLLRYTSRSSEGRRYGRSGDERGTKFGTRKRENGGRTNGYEGAKVLEDDVMGKSDGFFVGHGGSASVLERWKAMRGREGRRQEGTSLGSPLTLTWLLAHPCTISSPPLLSLHSISHGSRSSSTRVCSRPISHSRARLEGEVASVWPVGRAPREGLNELTSLPLLVVSPSQAARRSQDVVVLSRGRCRPHHAQVRSPYRPVQLAFAIPFILTDGVDSFRPPFRLQEGMSYSYYMSLYTVSYNYCTSSKLPAGESRGLGLGSGRSKHARPPSPLPSFFLRLVLRELILVLFRLLGPRWSEPDGSRPLPEPPKLLHRSSRNAQRRKFQLMLGLLPPTLLSPSSVKQWLDGKLSSLTDLPSVLSNDFQASDPLHDLPLLIYYAGEWDRYTTGANYVNRLFTYLNRHWVKREKDEGRKGVYGVYIVSSRSSSSPLRRLRPPSPASLSTKEVNQAHAASLFGVVSL